MEWKEFIFAWKPKEISNVCLLFQENVSKPKMIVAYIYLKTLLTALTDSLLKKIDLRKNSIIDCSFSI